MVPPGEASVYTEGTKGQYSYYAISDGSNSGVPDQDPHRVVPAPAGAAAACTGYEIADLVTVLGSIDFVMADVDR